MTLLRVAIVEDQPAIRQALMILLGGSPGFTCAGAFPSAEAALAAPAADPDVVLLDIGLPGLSGIEALDGLRRTWPRAEFLMLTVQDDEDRIFAALAAGASGYLLKSTPADRILAAARDLHEGGAPMSAGIARKVVQTFAARPAPVAPDVRAAVADAPDEAAEPLTSREREVLDLLVSGRSNRQIADALFVSPNTVATHIKGIYAKLHVRSRAEVIARHARRGA